MNGRETRLRGEGALVNMADMKPLKTNRTRRAGWREGTRRDVWRVLNRRSRKPGEKARGGATFERLINFQGGNSREYRVLAEHLGKVLPAGCCSDWLSQFGPLVETRDADVNLLVKR